MKKAQNTKCYLALSVALATFFVYLPTLKNRFLEWDDQLYIFENPYIKSVNTKFFKWAFSNFYASNWHPLTWISHALDYAVWGLNPLGHHLTNIILHSVNSLVVVFLVIRLVEVFKERTTNKGQVSFMDNRTILIAGGITGSLFGLHPVHVESVAWVSERKDLLCALFFMLSIMAYVSFVIPNCSESSCKRGSGQARMTNNQAVITGPGLRFFNKYYLFSLGFFILALLSKPMAVSLPAVLLILDWYPFERVQSFKAFRAALVEKLPFIAMSLLSSILTVVAQRAGGAIQPMEFTPLSTRVLVGVKSLIAYLWKMTLSLNLIPFYPYPEKVALFSLEYISAIALMIGITIACVILAGKRKLWLAVWCYYFVTLLPVLGIVKVGGQSMADRYTYLPSLGPFLIIGLLAAWISRKINTFIKWGTAFKTAGATIAVLVFVSLSYLTIKQISIWENSLVLWDYVIEKDPGISHAYSNRGIAFQRMDQLDRAIEDFSRALTLDPSRSQNYYNRGIIFQRRGQLDKAIEDYSRAIAINPSYYMAYGNRGLAFESINRLDKAIEDYNRVIALYPSYYIIYAYRGRTFKRMGHIDKAIADFTAAINLNQNDALLFRNRGFIYLEDGQIGPALVDLKRACGLGDGVSCKSLQHGINRGP